MFLGKIFTKMSQNSWGLFQQNRRTLVIGGHEFTKKNRKQWMETLALPCRSAINGALNRQKVNERPTLPPIVPLSTDILKYQSNTRIFVSSIAALKIQKGWWFLEIATISRAWYCIEMCSCAMERSKFVLYRSYLRCWKTLWNSFKLRLRPSDWSYYFPLWLKVRYLKFDIDSRTFIVIVIFPYQKLFAT